MAKNEFHRAKNTMSPSQHVVIEKDIDGFYAYCPALKGCHTQGDTLDEVMRNIQAVVELYLETLAPNSKL